MFIKDKTLLVAFSLFFVVVALVVGREIWLGQQFKQQDQIINNVASQNSLVTDNNQTSPVLAASDLTVGQGKTLFFFGDLTCVACKQQWQTLRSFQSRESQKIQIVWKDIIDPGQNESLKASLAAHCATKVWPQAVDWLYANQTNLNNAQYLTMADNLKLKVDDFKTCLNDKKILSSVQANVGEAIQLGISQTPTVYVDNRWYIGGLNETELQTIFK